MKPTRYKPGVRFSFSVMSCVRSLSSSAAALWHSLQAVVLTQPEGRATGAWNLVYRVNPAFVARALVPAVSGLVSTLRASTRLAAHQAKCLRPAELPASSTATD